MKLSHQQAAFPERSFIEHTGQEPGHHQDTSIISLRSKQARIAPRNDDRMEQAIHLWLFDKYALSKSALTETLYGKTLQSLRAYLQERQLDLDSPLAQLIPALQTWVYLRTSLSQQQGKVAPSTSNQRIAAISSFYDWMITYGWYQENNPAEQLARSPVQKYTKAQPLTPQEVRNKLKKINRSTPRGLRDYVLLQVAVNTGRSAKELTSLVWQCVEINADDTVTLLFTDPRAKNALYNVLDSRLSQLFLHYLQTIYPFPLENLDPHAPIWISFSDRTYGQRIGAQTIADICEAHLGVSSVKSLRYTFAMTLEDLGAPVTFIQEELGHANIASTKDYLSRLKKACTPHASALADAFGVGSQCQ
ncbi:tyrosine-type recombinase/integrase [Tengunoibacter tsumagoiensis]|uniref:Tyr recombinase domain-containing protein n=1 Tax=Tengunoibacter tsumagoiensis TaxID=2014871 RepID=A0A402A6Y5_9CHLR|nr:tyrosine-type recombinase/integrase [Tengunoibacter tsumagoiensis]GCE14907.1 hypothetical protein KTT_47660 [Tengunoibacter tsumagoiensis]